MVFVKCSLVALALLALQHQTLAQVLAARGSASGGLFGSANDSEGDLSAGDVSSPAENNGYLPPIGGSPSDQIPAFSGLPKTPEENSGSINLAPAIQPQVGCAAALLCVEEQFCNMQGVISKSPVQLTEAQKLRRVPMVDCRNPDNGVVGKCCRNPDYVDPWPAGNLSPEQLKQGFDEQGFPKFLNLSKTKPQRPLRPVPVPTSSFGQVIRPQQPIATFQPAGPVSPISPIQPPHTGFSQNQIVPETKPFQQPAQFGQVLQPAFQTKPIQNNNPFLQQQPKPFRPNPIEAAEFSQQAKQPEIVIVPENLRPHVPEQPQVIVPEQPEAFIPQRPSGFQLNHQHQLPGFTTEQPQVFHQLPGFTTEQPEQPEHIFAQPEQPEQFFVQPEQPKESLIHHPEQPAQRPIHFQPAQPQQPEHYQPAQPQQPEHYQPAQPQQPEHYQPAQPQQPTHYQPAQPQQPIHYQPAQPQQPTHYQPAQPQQPIHYQPTQPQQPANSQIKEQPKGPFDNFGQNIVDSISHLNPFLVKPDQPAVEIETGNTPDVPLPSSTSKPFFTFPSLPGFSGPKAGESQPPVLPPVSIAPHTPGAQCGIINQVHQSYAEGLNDVQTPFGEIPWQAMVLHNAEKKLLCSGAVIAPNVVMTAAHCVYGINPSEVSIKVGEWKLGYELKHEEPLPFEIAQVQSIEMHPGYQLGGPGSDLAMLFLERPVKLDQHVDTICLSQQPSVPQRKCISVGWGKTVLQLHAAGALMNKIEVDTLSQEQCRSRLQGAESPLDLDDSLVCVKAHKQNNNLCQVDVGGPLACDRGDGHYELVGVYSQDTGCLPTNQVATFALIDTKWVNKMLNSPKISAPQLTPEAPAVSNYQGPQPAGDRIHYHPQQPGVPCDCQQGTQPAGSNSYLPPY